jgi:phage terminase small subunit
VPLKKPRGGKSVPVGLSDSAAHWYRVLRAEFDIKDEAGRLLLETAMRAFDRGESARVLLERDGVVIADRWGQQKPHPAATIERDARAGMLAALKALNLDVEPLRDKLGRPGGS